MNRDSIKRVFGHYMSMLYMNAMKRKPESDNYAEWDEIIDNIIDVTKREISEEARNQDIFGT